MSAVLLVRAFAWLHFRADVLSDFEIDLIREVHARRRRDPSSPVTPAELAVIEDAVAAMRSAPRQDLTSAGLAA